jgi:23S rRNA pseudouridine955/2504/2580 synthase
MKNFKKITVKITENEAGQRCDRFLKKYLINTSLGNIYKMLRKKVITVNGGRAKENLHLQTGDIIEFKLKKEDFNKMVIKNEIEDADCNLNIIYEDNNILLINKPAGVIVHPDRKHKSNTLADKVVNYLIGKKEYIPENETTFKPASINRLDLNTSGIVIFAKNYGSLKILNQAMRNNNIKKYYLTLVKNNFKNELTIKAFLEKDISKNIVRISSQKKSNSKKIITRYKPLKNFNNSTLLEVELITGRPHQIRAHLKTLGFPVAGDSKYGDKDWNKKLRNTFNLIHQFLHSYLLKFDMIDSNLNYLSEKSFTAPLPENLKQIIDRM